MDETSDAGKISIIQTHFEWKINTARLSCIVTKEEYIISPTFNSYSAKDEKNLWHLSLYPKGEGESSDGYMGLFLNSDNDDDITITYTLSLLTNNREKIRTVEFENQKVESKYGFGTPDFLLETFLLNPINDIIDADNNFTILCTIDKKSSNDENINQDSSYKQMIKNIFENKDYSDFTVIAADGIKLSLHKCILAERSSVFKAMFDANMVEKKENSVKIDDYDSSVLNNFFKYLYDDKMDDDFSSLESDLLIALLILAEKYNVTKLKKRCEVTMSLKLKIDNVIEYLKVADMHNAEILISNVIYFMASNLKKIQNKPEFESITAKQLRKIIECHLKLEE